MENNSKVRISNDMFSAEMLSIKEKLLHKDQVSFPYFFSHYKVGILRVKIFFFIVRIIDLCQTRKAMQQFSNKMQE